LQRVVAQRPRPSRANRGSLLRRRNHQLVSEAKLSACAGLMAR
jgi:hypothetical protein